MLRVSIDIGGTFTDVVAEAPDRMVSVKALTTPHAPEQGALDGVTGVLDDLDNPFLQSRG